MAPPSPDSGSGTASRGSLLGLLAVSGLVFTAYYFGLRHGRPLFLNDTYEYAQAARNLAEGHGLKTDAATVLEVAQFGHRGLPIPYYMHDPGNSLLMAAAFRLFGAKDIAVGLGSGLCFVLLAPLTYALGLRFLSHEASLLGGLLVSVNAHLLVYAGAGYSETPIAFGLTGLLLLLWVEGPVALVAAGTVFGGLVLLRVNALPFLPWCLLFVGTARGATRHGVARLLAAGRSIALFVLGAACVLGPNAIRNLELTGRATFTMHGSTLVLYTDALKAIPGKASDRFSHPPSGDDALGYALAHPVDILDKIAWQSSRELETLFRGGQLPRGDRVTPLFVLLFAFGVLFAPEGENPARRRFRWLVASLVLTALLVGATFHLRWRHLYGFLPVAILFAADGLTRVASGRRWGVHLTTGFLFLAVALLGAGPMLDTVGQDAERVDRPDRFHRKLGAFVADRTDANALVLLLRVNDRFNPMGNALAWYARRTLVEYSRYTLDSPVLRGARPAVVLLVGSGAPAENRAAVKEGDIPPEALGLGPVATYSHDLGTATLYCPRRGCRVRE